MSDASQSLKSACRMAACRESLNDGKAWSFYLINDSASSLQRVMLKRVRSEWGSQSAAEAESVAIGDVAVSEHALVWRADGDAAEFRLTVEIGLEFAGGAVALSFEFPKLYRQGDLPVVAGLGKSGLQVRPSDVVQKASTSV